jgi:phosphatidate cytidylyltransferase
MHPVVYYILFFLAIGAAGMALANRKAAPVIRRQRWLKYFTYIIFTGVVVLGIFYDFLPWVAAIISLAALVELWKVNDQAETKPVLHKRFSFLVLILAATGFVFFTVTFHYSFLLYIYLQVIVFDGFCQITGQLIGKHPLVPTISPAKTREGLAGGWLFCVAVAVMTRDWVSLPLHKAALIGVLTGLTCMTGDLLASWYKRTVGVKDYSNWLPGQGGFLDRFDSFLVTGAVYFILYSTIFKAAFQSFSKQ